MLRQFLHRKKQNQLPSQIPLTPPQTREAHPTQKNLLRKRYHQPIPRSRNCLLQNQPIWLRRPVNPLLPMSRSQQNRSIHNPPNPRQRSLSRQNQLRPGPSQQNLLQPSRSRQRQHMCIAGAVGHKRQLQPAEARARRLGPVQAVARRKPVPLQQPVPIPGRKRHRPVQQTGANPARYAEPKKRFPRWDMIGSIMRKKVTGNWL